MEKANCDAYYAVLQKVRTEGDWEGWLRFFLKGVLETSQQAVQTAKAILQLFDEDRRKIETLKRPATSATRVHQYLQTRPLTWIQSAATALNLTLPTVITALSNLESLGIVQELTGKQRNRMFAYGQYLKILEQGTEQRNNV